MANINNQGNWEKIQKSVQETERLMGQKKYNLSMIKARQTMEFMVKLQCDKAGIVESSTDQMIRELYESKSISKSTAEHYLQILSIGNKATKEGDNSAYNANQAYHVLSQEIYAFADSDKTVRPRRSSASRQQTRSQSGQSQSQSRKRSSSSASSSRSAKNSKSSGLNTNDLIKLFIPIVLVIVLIFLIKVLTPDKDPTSETTTPAAPQTTTEAQVSASTEPVPEVPTETAAPVIYKTTTTLNVRSGPSTETERIGKLDPDQTVNFVRDHDDFWAVILYNDQEAYVAKQYLTVAAE